MSKENELKKELESLKKRVTELESKPKVEYHYHYSGCGCNHYHYPYYQPLQPHWPYTYWIYPNGTGTANLSANTTTIASQWQGLNNIPYTLTTNA